MRPEIRDQIAKAESWLQSCRDLKWAAHARLKAGAPYPEAYNLHRDVDAAEARAAAAYEDLQAWRRLGRTIR
jgi:hypothetical protein